METKVNDLIGQGYRPLGGIAVSNHWPHFCQAMVKRHGLAGALRELGVDVPEPEEPLPAMCPP